MSKLIKIIVGFLLILTTGAALSEKHLEEKSHELDHHNEKAEKHEVNGKKEETVEENSKIGPEKGILKADEYLGFILSPEAIRNFEIKTLKLSGAGPWLVPTNARMLSQNEVNLFRIRNGFIKRIDFKTHSNQGATLNVSSSDLSAGDEIIIHGMGFVRIAELAAFGGTPEGHSH